MEFYLDSSLNNFVLGVLQHLFSTLGLAHSHSRLTTRITTDHSEVTIDHQPPGDVTGVTFPQTHWHRYKTILSPGPGLSSGVSVRSRSRSSGQLIGAVTLALDGDNFGYNHGTDNFNWQSFPELYFTFHCSHSLAAWIRRNTHCLCFELKGKYELLLVYCLFIYWTLADWKVPDWMSGVPGVSMQQDQSFCFPVSDVGPALPESGDLSQHSGNCLMMESLLS